MIEAHRLNSRGTPLQGLRLYYKLLPLNPRPLAWAEIDRPFGPFVSLFLKWQHLARRYKRVPTAEAGTWGRGARLIVP